MTNVLSTTYQSVHLNPGDLMLSSMRESITQLENQITHTRNSQDLMIKNITVLSDYLHGFNESEVPYDLQVYVDKLHDSKRRIAATETTMGQLHDRLSRLQRQIAREVYNTKKLILGNVYPPPEK
ncbi:unnamed protein product [Auanema sp. JU1783]|nr:unnamed protein product [Auanema sp. JU1783]